MEIPFFSEIAQCENACATSDTYTLKDLIKDQNLPKGAHKSHYKIVNTGTLDKYVTKWGIKPMKYLGDEYLFPVALKNDFQNKLGKTYCERAASPKIIIKGLTHFDCALDLEGEFIPGKQTLVIATSNVDLLFALAALLNSKIISFYIKFKYPSATYNKGTAFTYHMINNIPIPRDLDYSRLAELAKIAYDYKAKITNLTYCIYSTLISNLSFSGNSIKGMDRWYFNEPNKFFSDIERQTISKKVPINLKAELASHYIPIRANAIELSNLIHSTSEEIDNYMYEKYELNNANISTIESLEERRS
ncbi:MAG: hypothetical protein LUE17_17700 [Planctomycetaceae bacterium]|nr:hypothetical protein [Planctomycetaceae bacterium]